MKKNLIMGTRIVILWDETIRGGFMDQKKGAVFNILNEVYKAVCAGNQMDEVRKRIVRVQIALKTGLNMGSYGPETMDVEAEIKKVLEVVRGPEIGLKNFEYKG
jgi:hypothetical protein